jgi:hypothetical protein
MPIKNASLTLGIKASYVESSHFQADKEIITACISEGKPVIAFGVIGPSDAVILTGYDEDGDVLLGWSTFQDISDDHNEPHDSSGYFRKSAWHGNLKGYVIFGSEKHATDLKAITVKALKYIPEIINTPFLSGRICGLKALAEWRNAILDDNNFNSDTELIKWRYLCYTINTTMLLDQLSAPIFLDSASAYIPDFTETLETAALLYRKNSETIIEARQLIADDFSPSAQERFLNREIRVKYAGLMDDIYIRTSEASALIKSCAEKLD